jgi:hypothetical protein
MPTIVLRPIKKSTMLNLPMVWFGIRLYWKVKVTTIDLALGSGRFKVDVKQLTARRMMAKKKE